MTVFGCRLLTPPRSFDGDSIADVDPKALKLACVDCTQLSAVDVRAGVREHGVTKLAKDGAWSLGHLQLGDTGFPQQQQYQQKTTATASRSGA